MRLGRLPALLGLLLCAACGSVAVTRLAKDADYREGIRFYRPQPYLLVSAKGTDRAAQVVWLPKKDEEYVLRVRSGMGSVDAKFALQDGWNLTEYGESRTPETSDLIGAAAGVAKAAEGLVAGPRGELEPGLYAIEFDPATGLVRALRRIDLTKEASR
ncbi:MAG TPA: hypothetical protein VFL12_04995 [Thermoanaerobaculia bacterium]|nr:hypothetical protein [Thermoanaerobaculia bacterium]